MKKQLFENPLTKSWYLQFGGSPADAYSYLFGGNTQNSPDDVEDVDYEEVNDEPEFKSGGWIKKAIKHPGRCTPGSPNYDCPKGSPQWNLAQRFKHGDLHKKKGKKEIGGEPCIECGDGYKQEGGSSSIFNYGQFPAMKEGGAAAYLKAIIAGADKHLSKKKTGGSTSPQGVSMDSFLADRNNDFKQYLANNAMRKLAEEEADHVSAAHDMFVMAFGGVPYFAQFGTEMPLTQSDPNQMQPNVMPASYIPPDQLAQGTPVTGVQPSMFDVMSRNMQAASMARNPLFNKQPQQQQQGNSFSQFLGNNGKQIGEGIIAGETLTTSFLNQADQNNQLKKLRQKTDADSIFTPVGSSRGDYDVNSGMLRPNKYVPVQNQGYKEGGEYMMSDDDIKRIIEAGGEIEYLD